MLIQPQWRGLLGLSYKFIIELMIMNNEKDEFEYENGLIEPNKLIKALTKVMDEWINLKSMDKL